MNFLILLIRDSNSRYLRLLQFLILGLPNKSEHAGLVAFNVVWVHCGWRMAFTMGTVCLPPFPWSPRGRRAVRAESWTQWPGSRRDHAGKQTLLFTCTQVVLSVPGKPLEWMNTVPSLILLYTFSQCLPVLGLPKGFCMNTWTKEMMAAISLFFLRTWISKE